LLRYGPGLGCTVLRGKVIPSQRVTDKQHSVWVCVDSSGSIETGHCTCMAGYGVFLCE